MPPSGVFDRYLSSIANRLLRNNPDAALLEFAIAGPSLEFHSSASFAITAHEALFELNDIEAPAFKAIHAASGSVLRFKNMKGWFGYIAFSGGISCDLIFGSASTYERGGIGTRLKKRSNLSTGNPSESSLSLRTEYLSLGQNNIVPILPGIHFDQFSERSKDLFVSTEYQISPQSDRMGIRFKGTALDTPRILRSVPALPGSVQITSSGLPLILGPEGPVTGGYPQIAILPEISWTVLAGLSPGQSIRFDWMDAAQSRAIRNYRNSIFNNANAWETIH